MAYMVYGLYGCGLYGYGQLACRLGLLRGLPRLASAPTAFSRTRFEPSDARSTSCRITLPQITQHHDTCRKITQPDRRCSRTGWAGTVPLRTGNYPAFRPSLLSLSVDLPPLAYSPYSPSPTAHRLQPLAYSPSPTAPRLQPLGYSPSPTAPRLQPLGYSP